jgi:hypothetical protein
VEAHLVTDREQGRQRQFFFLSTFFAIEFPRHRFRIGVPHIDFYSSCKPTYNKRVTDEVNASKLCFTSKVTVTTLVSDADWALLFLLQHRLIFGGRNILAPAFSCVRVSTVRLDSGFFAMAMLLAF